MGVVYLAEHLRLRRRVALKVLAPELSGDERFRQRFVRESELAASLEHPSIVPIHDAGEADGVLYIAMRFVEGTDLKTLIEREGFLPPGRAVAILGQVASALDAAHAKGLIHRDVKPANVLLDRDDHAYLTDFGLTKRPDQTTGLTRTGQFMGTVDYAAPEQFQGKPLDARTDVYSLSCVAYECLAGEVPFRRDQEAAAMYAHLRELPPKLSATRPELPDALDSVVAKGMAKGPDDRYRSAGALARALQEIVAPPIPEPGAGLASRRRARIGAAAILALIGVVGVVAILSLAGGQPHPAAHPSPSKPSPPFLQGVIRIDPATGRLDLKSADVTGNLVDAYGSVWLTSHSGLLKFSLASDNVVDTIDPLQGQAHGELCFAGADCGLTFGAGRVWLSVAGVFGIDPKTNLVTPKNTTLTGLLTFYAKSVWVAEPGVGKLFKLDPKTGRIEKRFSVESTNRPSAIAGGEGAVWVVNGAGETLTRVDPSSGHVTPIPLEHRAEGVAAGEGGVWVTDGSGSVTEWSPDGTSAVQQIPVGGPTGAIAVGLGYVWVVTDRFVARIDPATKSVTRIPVNATAICVGKDGVWATTSVNAP